MQLLKGIKVLDFSRWLPGQYCAMLLGDYGADVIKVEAPQGDPPRRFTPQKEANMSYWHLMLNRNKKGLTLDIKKAAGQKILRRLLSEADVFLEGFRPGYLARYGLDYASVRALNPRLIYCSITGFGPNSYQPAHDLNVVGLAGLNYFTDAGAACVPEVQVSAMGSALNALSAIALALYARTTSGEGQQLDINLYATALSLQATSAASLWGSEETGTQPFGRSMHYYNVYRCRDGRYLSVGTIEPKFWQRFCQLIECPELSGRQFDFAHKKTLQSMIAAKISSKTLAEWLSLIGTEEFCVTPVNTLAEALTSPLAEAEQLLTEQASDIGNSSQPIRYLGAPVRFNGSRGSIRRRAPRLGEHSANILAELGYSNAEILQLADDGVI